MSKRKNITSPIRSGFDYQDLWTLKLCGEWLLNPEKFKWIQIEINPTENNKYYLDDIGLLDKQNQYHFYQVKFKNNAEYQWKWDDFLLKRKGKTGELPSLFGKWATSFESIDYANVLKAVFVTNGNLSDDVKKFLVNNKIDIKEISAESPDLYNQIKAEVGDDNFTEKYFEKFEFLFENKPKEDVEKEIREVFYNDIRATKHGVNNLYLELKNQASKKHTIRLTLNQIREWCEFDNPRPLNENFEVPLDFQFFDKATHENILQDLQNSDGGTKIIFGKPGVGKSVYLSQLSEDMKHQEIVVIKHHYHINPSDSSLHERLNSERVIEAIKAQFKSLDCNKYLGELANQDSQGIDLREFISSVAKRLFKDSKNFVIIIDGLDHVVRERNVDELKDFLDEVFYPQKGLWIIFGMQPQVKNESILQPIFSKCSKEDWIEIQGLGKVAVSSLIEKNITDLNLPDNQEIFNDLVDKIYESTQGNSLHLRYTLTQLKNRLDNNLVTEYECKDLIPYGDNIEKYYESLWNTLEEGIQAFLLTFISVDFQFTRKQFIECISSFDNSSTAISQYFKRAVHLVDTDLRKRLRIYHNSFRVFLYEQKEWEEQKQVIKKNVKKWLENSEYENLKWAELRKLEYELGNDKPILEIDRKWLMYSITHPRNPSQIVSQLELSSRAAFDKNDFAKALKISHLNNYYQNAQDFVEDAARLIWIESIKANTDFINELILREIPSNVLVVVADIANQFGKSYLIDEIIEILAERLDYQEYRAGEAPSASKAIINVIPYDRTHKVKRVHKYIVQFEDLEITSVLFKIYVKNLLILDQKTKVNELLGFDLNEEERKSVLECCIKHDLKYKASEFTNIIEMEENNSLLEQAYLILQCKKLSCLPELPNYKNFPSTIEELTSEREKWSINFHNYFLLGIIYPLCNEQDKIEEWIDSAPSQWPAQATAALFKSALKIAGTIQKNNKIDYKDIFNELSILTDLKWPEDRDRIEFKFSLKNALTNILKDIALIKYFINDSLNINNATYKNITSTSFFLQDDVFELVLDLKQTILEEDVYNILLNEKIKTLENTVNYFPERSEEYAKLEILCKLYRKGEKAKGLLTKAVDNFLGYGYHKDIYLFGVLESIELCAKSRINNKIINNWTQRIIPIITNVGEYTDRDETNHLKDCLADFLSKDNKHLLFKFYFDHANKEKLYPAQNLFMYVIRSLIFTEDVEIALATTALDKGSLEELKEKAKASKGAQISLGIIQEYLGEINYKDERGTSSYDFKEEKINYAEVTPEKLEDHLEKVETKWNNEKYIIGWTKYWLDQDDNEKIYNLIKSIVLKDGNKQSVSGEIEDILYPLAYEFDNNEAFNFLCSAQINGHGWSSHWTDKKKAERRWDFVREKYPKRYLEFFKSSANYCVPISRGVDYLCRFDDLDKAIAITEASVEFAEDLMADLDLQSPDWTKGDFQEVDELGLLLQRLVWPSPLVRERAATAIGDLLANSPKKEEIYTSLLGWISSWKIESIIAIGLLPIIKAFQVCQNKVDLAFIKVEDVINSIQASSVVVETLLSEIALQTKEKIKIFPGYISSEQLPDSYEPNDFFHKNIKTILAPIYFSRAQEIEGDTRQPFLKLWAYNTEIISLENNIEFLSNHDFYGHHENDKVLTGFSTKASEVYRSAFLRVLYGFYDCKLIPQDFYLEYAFATLPVDLSFWKIIPNRAPKWWPNLIDSNTDNKEKISTIQFKEPIEDISKYKEDNKIILAAEGAIEPAEGWTEAPTHSFSLIGFGYKVLDADLPKPEEVAKKILYAPKTLIFPTKSDSPVRFLNSSVHFDIHSDSVQIKDLAIIPFVTRNRDLTISLWQHFRDITQSFNIHERLREGFKNAIESSKWLYKDKNNNDIVVFKDWIEGLQERYELKMPVPHGHYILIDEKFLAEKLKANGLRLGYVLKTTFRSQKYNVDDVRKIENFKLIDVSKIIIN
jgi:hypothetical protein